MRGAASAGVTGAELDAAEAVDAVEAADAAATEVALASTTAGSHPRRSEDQDALDAQLVHALQRDGRRSILDLARDLGVSRDTVSHRLRMLTDSGELRILVGINPMVSGQRVMVHLRVEVVGAVSPVVRQAARLAHTVFVSSTSGALAMVIEARLSDTVALHHLLDAVRALPGVRRILVSTYVEMLRGISFPPLPARVALDEVDDLLIAELQRNGRATYQAMSQVVHLSPSATRARVRRLLDAGIVRIAATKSGGITHARLGVGFGISAAGDTAAIRAHLLHAPDVDFAARSHGTYDFVGTVVSGSAQQLLDALDVLRAQPGVTALDTWSHISVAKEDYTRNL